MLMMALNELNNLDHRKGKCSQPIAARNVPKPFEGHQDQPRERPATLARIQTCGITKQRAQNVAIALRKSDQ